MQVALNDVCSYLFGKLLINQLSIDYFFLVLISSLMAMALI